MNSEDDKLQVRKIIALGFGAAYIVFTAFSLWVGKPVPETFTGIVISVISYYFGKSTALDTPKLPEAIQKGEDKLWNTILITEIHY